MLVTVEQLTGLCHCSSWDNHIPHMLSLEIAHDTYLGKVYYPVIIQLLGYSMWRQNSASNAGNNYDVAFCHILLPNLLIDKHDIFIYFLPKLPVSMWVLLIFHSPYKQIHDSSKVHMKVKASHFKSTRLKILRHIPTAPILMFTQLTHWQSCVSILINFIF